MDHISKYVGLWYGTSVEDSFHHFTELVISGVDKESGERELYVCRKSKYYEHHPTTRLSRDSNDELYCEQPHWGFSWPVTIRGKFLADASIFKVTFSGSIFELENYTVDLRKYDPRCLKYQRPAESLSYSYRVPSVSPSENYFPAADAASEGLSKSDLEATVNAFLAFESGRPGGPQVDGFLVLKNEKLVLEEYFWGLDKETVHEISSCTKSIGAILVGIALDQGLVDLEDSVADTFPEIETDWRHGEPIRLRHVLAMASGTVSEEPTGPDGLADPGLLASESIAKDVLASKRTAKPGEVYNYDNSLPFLVACYLEKKTGMTVESFADKFLFHPLGIKDRRWTYLRQLAIDGRPSAMLSGGLQLNLRDFAKIGQMMLDGGVYRGERIVSERYVQLSTTQHTKAGQWPYGFYWHLNTKDQRHLDNIEGFLALGQGEQVIAVLPRESLVVCWMSSTWVNKFGYRVAMKEINDKWIKNIKVQHT
jgi:CubicO group peptidase (beta-lactamase class C family)